MLDRLRSYPSDIAQAAVDYLLMLESKTEIAPYHREVLYLFLESLKYTEDGFLEDETGDFLLSCHWTDIYGGAISGFLDYWFQGKVAPMDDCMLSAPDIMRDWIQWCFDKGYFELERYQDFMRSLPLGKTVEMKRLYRASQYLGELCQPVGEKENPNVLSFIRHSSPKIKIEGYMKLMDYEGCRGFFKTETGTDIGPVLLSQKLVNSLRRGDVINLSLGKFNHAWKVLEGGNIYSDGVIF